MPLRLPWARNEQGVKLSRGDRRALRARWGDDAAELACEAIRRWKVPCPRVPFEREAMVHAYRRAPFGDGWKLESLVRLEERAPFAFIVAGSHEWGGLWPAFVWVGDGFDRPPSGHALAALLADAQPDVTSCTEPLIQCFERYAPARVLRSEADVASLTRPPMQPSWMPDLDVLAHVEPPHFEGSRFVFCANKHYDGELVRVQVDSMTLGVDEHVLGRGAFSAPLGLP